MKKTMTRIFTFILSAVMVLTMAMSVPRTTYAANTISLTEIEKKMDTYIAWLNKTSSIYWNANESEATLKNALNQSTPDFSVGMTGKCCLGTGTSGVDHSRDCKVNGKAACTSNTFGGGRQCRGFARYFWYYLFGETVTFTSAKGNWTKYDGVPNGGLQAGDYVDCKGHAYIVRNVDSKGVIYAVHANGSASKKPCGVHYSGVYYNNSTLSTESMIDEDSSCVVLRYSGISSGTANQTVSNSCSHKYDDYGFCSCGAEYPIKLTSMNATYYAVKADVPIRKRPYSPVTIDSRLSQGETVTVVAKGNNSKNNLWYKLSDGSWVYSENVKESPVTFSGMTVKDNSSGNAKPYVTVTYKSGKKPASVGIYVGTSKSNLKKAASDSITHSKNPFNVWYVLKKEANLTLKAGTTYYYQFYAVIGGTEYKSSVASFKAK